MSESREKFEPHEAAELGGGDKWILRGLNNLESQIRDFRSEVQASNSAIDDRLRRLENKAAYLIGGIVVALAFVTFMGWILAPVVQALVQKVLG